MRRGEFPTVVWGGDFSEADRHSLALIIFYVLTNMARGHQKLQSQAKACVLDVMRLFVVDVVDVNMLGLTGFQAGEGACGQGGGESAEGQ
jgi:hypothetical protein